MVLFVPGTLSTRLKSGIGAGGIMSSTGAVGANEQKSIMSTRSDLDEVTTAILNAAKGKIQEAAAKQSEKMMKQGPTSRGVEGDFYIDRSVTLLYNMYFTSNSSQVS